MKTILDFLRSDFMGFLFIVILLVFLFWKVPHNPCDTDTYALDGDLLPKDCRPQ